MGKIYRFDGNYQAFGISSQAGERHVFNDAGTTSDTLDDNINADYLRGWGVTPTGAKPTKQSFNGLLFAISQTLSYLHQMGVAEYNASQEYHVGSQTIGSDGLQYRSITSPNIGHNPVTDGGTNWINDTATLQSNINTEASTRATADSTHAGLTNAHGASLSPTGSTIPFRTGTGQLEAVAATSSLRCLNLGQFTVNIAQKIITIPAWNGSSLSTVKIQFGSYTSTGTGFAPVVFASSYTSSVFGVFTSYDRTSSAGDYRAMNTPTLTGFNIGYDNGTNYWVAVGV